MLSRSRHIALRIPAGRMDEAIEHYKTVFGIREVKLGGKGVELVGSNFTFWLDEEDGSPTILQEWVTNDGPSARNAIEGAGGTVTGDSSSGFYVHDPFGMTYHVFVAEDPES